MRSNSFGKTPLLNTYLISELESLNLKMADAMFKEIPDKEITRQQSDEVWMNTHWHKIIANRILELRDDF